MGAIVPIKVGDCFIRTLKMNGKIDEIKYIRILSVEQGSHFREEITIREDSIYSAYNTKYTNYNFLIIRDFKDPPEDNDLKMERTTEEVYEKIVKIKDMYNKMMETINVNIRTINGWT